MAAQVRAMLPQFWGISGSTSTMFSKFHHPGHKDCGCVFYIRSALLYAKCPVKSMIKTRFFQLFYSIHIKDKARGRNLWKLHRLIFLTRYNQDKNHRKPGKTVDITKKALKFSGYKKCTAGQAVHVFMAINQQPAEARRCCRPSFRRMRKGSVRWSG